MKLFCLFVSFSLLIGEGWSVPECPDFSSSVCRLDLDNVLSIRNYEDSDAGNADNRCQFDCRQEPGCRNFTFFSPTVPGLRSTCLLFKSCKTSSFCASCVSGPPEPPLDTCGVKILLNSILLDLSHEEYNPGAIRKVAELARQPKQLEDNSEIESSGDGEVLTEGSGEENSNGSGSNEEDMSANEAESGDIENMVDKEDGENFSGKELDEDMSAKEDEQIMADKEEEEVMADKEGEEDMDDKEDDENEDVPEIEGIDDGLLNGEKESDSDNDSNEREDFDSSGDDNDEDSDENEDSDNDEYEETFGEEDYAEEEDQDNDKGNSENDDQGKKKRKPSFFHCLMGGYGPLGPIPSVDHLPNSLIPVLPRVPPLPPAFPLGTDGMFGTMNKGNLLACSPGAPITPAVLQPLIGGSPFGEGFLPLGIPPSPRFLAPGQCYTNRNDGWFPLGGPMNSIRLGSSISKMGNFLITSGGRGRDNDPQDDVEVLNLNKPERWRKLSKIRMMKPTYDHCTVALNKTAVLVTGGAGQGNSASIMDMKNKKVKETEPMKEPRSQHSCMKAKINGRMGVIVAGGMNDVDPTMRSVEFFDPRREKWFRLGNLRVGRRFPGIMARRNRLTIAGGETVDPFGQNIILDDMERMRGRRWSPTRGRLPQRRSRFASIRVPLNFF